MEAYSEKLSNKLNGLLVRTRDSKLGFENAAENVNHTALKAFFNNKAKERDMFEDQLKSVLKKYDQEVTDSDGSIKGSAHRMWMDLKSTFTSQDEEAMLEEAIRGEKKAVGDYKEMITNTHLGIQTKNILTNQLSMIEKSLETVKTLEDIH